ncbi:hypothetical protein HPP92_006198 [Vanilla planifolia]|uniref:Uncharacterized protein n=1 Tax=Vanilla planifolia TaxID=51239 RepID=A0A835RI95_VANPL|nr:hypothetical protein HPP92_006198 [Vanilla planifolia]
MKDPKACSEDNRVNNEDNFRHEVFAFKVFPWFCVMKLNGLFHPTGNLLNYQGTRSLLQNIAIKQFAAD